MKRKMFWTLFLGIIFFCNQTLIAQENKDISGYVYDLETGETLIGTTIALIDKSRGAVSNEYGFYSINVPKSTTQVEVNYLGYEKQIVSIESQSKIDIYLKPLPTTLQDVVITIDNRKVQNISGGQTITSQQLKEIPQLLGEPDIIKAVQIQPGIKTVTEGSSFYYVRGGNFDQNLVLLDEAPLYNPSHIMGLVSVINGDAIKSSQFYKGYFPAQYSGKLSSVLDIATKDGNNKKIKGTAAISTIGARATLEGPLVKNKASYLVSLRKSWVDMVVKAMKGNDILSPSYYDMNAKVNWKLSENDKLYASVYYGKDNMKYAPSSFNAQWHNSTATLRWNRNYSAKLFANTSLIYNGFQSGASVSKVGKEWKGSINEGRFIHRLSYYFNDKHRFVGGLKLGFHEFNPGWQKGEKNTIGTKKLWSSDVYLEHKLKLTPQLKLDYGINLKWMNTLASGSQVVLNKNYEVTGEEPTQSKKWIALEPRANINYTINKGNQIFAAYSRMNQYSHSLYPYQNDFDIFKMWVPVSNNVKPMQSDIYSVGYRYASKHFSMGLEGYYKNIRNQLDYTAYPDLQSKYYERYLRAGNGNSYGVELDFGYTSEKYKVEVNYAYSKTTLTTPDVNGGRKYVSKYDIPHQVNITGVYNINKRWRFSAYWKFASGKPFTLPVGTQIIEGGTTVIPIYGERYNARFFNNHRLDLMVTLLPKDTPKKLKGILSFGVMNAYGKDNPLSIDYSYIFTTLQPKSQTFFKWLPMISYQIKF